ncbi:hypothetical protein BJX76DRAFT_32194 [Aspergillus varians]
MPARSHSRITTACNSCRLRKQKCSGNRPKCIQCLDHRRNCDWPEQLKRGPAKGYIETLERRLQETENLLLGLLDQVSDSQLSEIPHPTAQLRSGKRGSEYWKMFPLRSVQDIRSWQEDCQPSAPECTSTSTPSIDRVEVTLPEAIAAPAVHREASQRPPQRPEPQPSLSVWSGAPSANFQQQFLW